MKKLSVALVALFIGLCCVNWSAPDINKGDALANRAGDYYLFHLCVPKNDYRVIDHIKVSVAWSGKPDELMNIIKRKANRANIDFDGIIFNENLSEAELIIFK